MARTRRIVAAAALAAAALAAASGAGRAQGLRTLHVDAFTMRADAQRIGVGQTFHVAIQVRVRERVAALDELVIPDVGTMHVLGDERRVTASPTGTTVVEVLTLEPVQAGSFTFTPAYLDAVDARTNRPSRFSSNPVRVIVVAPGAAFSLGTQTVWSIVRAAAITVVVIVVGIVLVIGAVVIVLAQRRGALQRTGQPAPVTVAPPPPPPRTTPRDAVASALRAYRTAPADGALLGLRGALFAAAGVSPGATLRDALAATSDGSLRAALAAAEHAAFGPAVQRDDASQRLVVATEEWLR